MIIVDCARERNALWHWRRDIVELAACGVMLVVCSANFVKLEEGFHVMELKATEPRENVTGTKMEVQRYFNAQLAVVSWSYLGRPFTHDTNKGERQRERWRRMQMIPMEEIPIPCYCLHNCFLKDTDCKKKNMRERCFAAIAIHG